MAKFAHVYVAKTKAFETVKESELKDLDPDKKTKLDVSLDSVSICSLAKKYAILQENTFRLVFVCYTAGKARQFEITVFEFLKLLRNLCRLMEFRTPV